MFPGTCLKISVIRSKGRKCFVVVKTGTGYVWGGGRGGYGEGWGRRGGEGGDVSISEDMQHVFIRQCKTVASNLELMSTRISETAAQSWRQLQVVPTRAGVLRRV